MRTSFHAPRMLAWLLSLAVLPLWAQTPPEALPVARDLHEQVFRIPVSVQDLYRRREQRQIPVTVFKPAGDGPFPMVVLNHGRATSAEKMAQPSRFRFEQQARYFVGKGFVVMVPTRVGYGETFDGFDPETNGGCTQPRIEPMSLAASDQVLAVVEFARSLPFVDAARWWVMGQSVGGLTTVATTWRNPPGLQGAVNFAGGTGGDPVARPGRSCAAAQIEQLWKSRAAQAKAPMLWLYWENDLFWGAQAPRDWHRAWVEGGGQAEFHQLSAVGPDGHSGFGIDMDRWVPLVDAFLAKAGYTQAALPPTRSTKCLLGLRPDKTCTPVFWPVPCPARLRLDPAVLALPRAIGLWGVLWVCAKHAGASPVSCMP